MNTPIRSFVFTLLLFVFAGFANADPQGITYSGGDGSTFEKAIIVNGATEETGVHAEYDYIAKHYPGYSRGQQSLQSHEKRMYDVLEFMTADKQQRTIYFDITGFFGKNQ